MLRRWLLPLAVTAAAACGGAGTGASGDGSVGAAPSGSSGPAAASVPGAVGSGSAPGGAAVTGTVVGRAVLRSDSSDLPGQPLRTGSVVVVPAVAERALWTALGLPPTDRPGPGS